MNERTLSSFKYLKQNEEKCGSSYLEIECQSEIGNHFFAVLGRIYTLVRSTCLGLVNKEDDRQIAHVYNELLDLIHSKKAISS